jgi:methylase of polypeptide subunit release factors
VLRPGGWLVCELGVGQEKQIQHVFARAGGYDTVEFVNDPQGAPRVVAARRGAS